MKRLRMPLSAAVVLACSSIRAVPQEAGALKIIPPHSVLHDERIGEWGARWWQWMALSPKGTNPVRDVSGLLAGLDRRQQGRCYGPAFLSSAAAFPLAVSLALTSFSTSLLRSHPFRAKIHRRNPATASITAQHAT